MELTNKQKDFVEILRKRMQNFETKENFDSMIIESMLLIGKKLDEGVHLSNICQSIECGDCKIADICDDISSILHTIKEIQREQAKNKKT